MGAVHTRIAQASVALHGKNIGVNWLTQKKHGYRPGDFDFFNDGTINKETITVIIQCNYTRPIA